MRHVPNLKKNIISLGTLDKVGCSITCEEGVIKVGRGSLVVMKEKMSGSLYALKGSTIFGWANASTNTMFDHNTKLLRLRVGHLDEKGMYELFEQGSFHGKKFGNLGFFEQCVYRKQKRASFRPVIHNTKGILDYIHSDL